MILQVAAAIEYPINENGGFRDVKCDRHTALESNHSQARP
jgi:hypothetical protein